MDMKLFKDVTRVEKDTLVDGNEIIILYAREEGARYDILIYRKKEFAEAYEVIERYKKTGELIVRDFSRPGQLNEYIRPVCMLVAEMKYGYRTKPEIVIAESE